MPYKNRPPGMISTPPCQSYGNKDNRERYECAYGTLGHAGVGPSDHLGP